jgi:hypothetical protein
MTRPHTLHTLKALLRNPVAFTEYTGGIRLREYQCSPMLAILKSVLAHRGLSFVIMFPRQSGKNELQAQLECYLLTLLSQTHRRMVNIAHLEPNRKAMRRLNGPAAESTSSNGNGARQRLHLRVGSARMMFFSGAQKHNVEPRQYLLKW